MTDYKHQREDQVTQYRTICQPSHEITTSKALIIRTRLGIEWGGVRNWRLGSRDGAWSMPGAYTREAFKVLKRGDLTHISRPREGSFEQQYC